MPILFDEVEFGLTDNSDFLQQYFQLDQTLGFGGSAEFYTTPAPSEDIWKKFEMDSPARQFPFTDFEDDSYFASLSRTQLDIWPSLGLETLDVVSKEAREIRHHDCMWAGSCHSDEHKRNGVAVKDDKNSEKVVTSVESSQTAHKILGAVSVVKADTFRTASEGVCVAKSERLRDSRTSSDSGLGSDGESPRPETPQSLSESEEDESSDDSVTKSWPNTSAEYGDDCESASTLVNASEVTGQRRTDCSVSKQTSVSDHSYLNDHSYHLMKGASTIKTDHLGIQTPSDSEEEIDVVSVAEKTVVNGRSKTTSTNSLPNNPSLQVRHQLQITVAEMAAHKKGSQHKQEGKTVPLRIMVGGDEALVRSVPASSLRTGMKRYHGDGGGSTKSAKRAKLHHSTPSPRKRGSRSGSDSEDPIEKRSIHNNMERQRRIDLRNAFDHLRVLVPEVEDNEKAAKVLILREAAKYCESLADKETSLLGKAANMRRTQEQLRARVSQLRRMLASKR